MTVSVSTRQSTSEKLRGVALRATLHGHFGAIGRIGWFPDGNTIATPSADGSVRLWDVSDGSCIKYLEIRSAKLHVAPCSPDGRMLACDYGDAIRIWGTQQWVIQQTLTGHRGAVTDLSWSRDGRHLVSCADDLTARVWDSTNGQTVFSTRLSSRPYAAVCSPNGQSVAICTEDGRITLWDPISPNHQRTLTGHGGAVRTAAWSPDGQMLASGSADATVRLWDLEKGTQIGILEGHTDSITSVAFSARGRLLASKSLDGSVRLWSAATRDLLAIIPEPNGTGWASGVAFHPSEPVLATLGDFDTAVRLWDLDLDALLGSAHAADTVHYANAKVVLVGDTGVGKSGLGLVLCQRPWTATESTHGRHVSTMYTTEADLGGGKTETREVFLWDLAGQPGYRVIHQLHLDQAAVAIVVFDSRSETDPFAGVRHWDRALLQAISIRGESGHPLRKFLVAARTDRGGIAVSPERVNEVVEELGFDRYFETSAKEGRQIAELADAIRESIDWSALPRASSSELFRRIKTFLLQEKKAGRILSSRSDLYGAFLRSENGMSESEGLRDQFDRCIAAVESQGLIRKLSFGDLVLLQPERLDAYASALVDAAREEPDGLGCLSERDVLAGRFDLAADIRVTDAEHDRQLLAATVEDLIRHEIAIREPSEQGTLLVFPSQITRNYPDLEKAQGACVTFRFEGPVQIIYSTLAARLSQSGAFRKKEMWQNAGTYTSPQDETCGVVLREIDEGNGQLTLFFEEPCSSSTRRQFEEFVHAQLVRRAIPDSVVRLQTAACRECGTRFADEQVQGRLDRGYDWIRCSVCDSRVSLMTGELVSDEDSVRVAQEMDEAAEARKDREAGIVSAGAVSRTPDFRSWAGGSMCTIALVFTDIVDSVAIANELGNEGMRVVRHRHFKRAGDLVGTLDGYCIKTIGDATMSAFRTVVSALDCILQLMANTGDERVKIRAAIHVGPVEIEDGDAFGAMVNYTSRVESQARGGEIWLSAEARNHVFQEGAHRHLDLQWTLHENRALKGFAGTHDLWSVEVLTAAPHL